MMFAQALAVMRLDLGEVRRSRWMVLSAALYVLLACVFMVTAMRESSVFAFTGMSRVLLSLCHSLLVLLPLLAVGATCQSVNRAREDGTLEVLLSQPLTRRAYLVGVTATRYVALAAPLAVLLLSLVVIGLLSAGSAGTVRFAARAGAVCGALLWAFTGLGVAVSVFTRNQARAMVYGLLLGPWAWPCLISALVGAMLQWSLNPRVVFALAALNPVQCARLALLLGADPGPRDPGAVGYYLATRIGPRGLFALGTLWPFALGTLAWGVAASRLSDCGDAVLFAQSRRQVTHLRHEEPHPEVL